MSDLLKHAETRIGELEDHLKYIDTSAHELKTGYLEQIAALEDEIRKAVRKHETERAETLRNLEAFRLVAENLRATRTTTVKEKARKIVVGPVQKNITSGQKASDTKSRQIGFDKVNPDYKGMTGGDLCREVSKHMTYGIPYVLDDIIYLAIEKNIITSKNDPEGRRMRSAIYNNRKNLPFQRMFETSDTGAAQYQIKVPNSASPKILNIVKDVLSKAEEPLSIYEVVNRAKELEDSNTIFGLDDATRVMRNTVKSALAALHQENIVHTNDIGNWVL